VRSGDTSITNKRAILGWCFYDWANSAFATSGTVAIIPVYFVLLFQAEYGQQTEILGFNVTASSVWSLLIALSTMVVALTSPVLGVIADRLMIRKALVTVYTLAGAGFTFLLFFSAYTGSSWMWIAGCFLLANIGFAGGNVFYNSLLPHLVSNEDMDSVSSKGFAYGYVGGGLLLAIHLAILFYYSGSDFEDFATRACIASIGLWWFGWAIISYKLVPEPGGHLKDRKLVSSAVKVAGAQVVRTLRDITRFRALAFYLLTYLLFNDAIQTVIAVAGAYGPDVLGVTIIGNIVTILVVQFVAAGGAALFAWFARLLGAKRALTYCLVGWVLVITFALAFAPLIPSTEKEVDLVVSHNYAGTFVVSQINVEVEAIKSDSLWAAVSLDQKVSEREIRDWEQDKSAELSLMISGGARDGEIVVGDAHKSSLGDGPIDWWPILVRSKLWEPLSMSVDLQWLVLGVVLGLVMGGSQALARSLFAVMTPLTKSGEFFGFFGLVGKASSVFGPMVYVVVTGVYDTRVAIFALLSIIVVGTLLLVRVNVEEGVEAAKEEDRRLSSAG
jgi:UMF1 family MFS transporter